MIHNTALKYGNIAKVFHWLVFVLVLTLVIVGFFWKNTGDIKYTVINLHKLTGLLTAIIVLLRIGWTLHNPKPRLLKATRLDKIIVHSVHGLIYLALLGMPVSGWIMATAANHAPQLAGWALAMPGVAVNKALADAAGQVHLILAWVLIVLVVLHILAALKHHFINKDNVLMRMMPGD